MLELLSIYKFPMLAGTVAAAVLSFLGIHLATRDKAMKTLCLSQGATLGILLGIGLLHEAPFVEEVAIHYSPVALAFLVALCVYWLGESISKKRTSSKNTYFISIFVALLSASSLVSSAFPSLETHLAQVFFGDLATLSDRDAFVCLFLSLVAGLYLFKNRTQIAEASFEGAIFGFCMKNQTFFHLFSILLICFCVQFLGFLFTTACLFIPTSILVFQKTTGLRRHLVSCGVLSTISVLGGFCLSLEITRFPTVPTIVLVMLGLGFSYLGIRKVA